MADITRFDVSLENFDHYFAVAANGMTEKQKDSLPKDLYFKLYRTAGKGDDKTNFKLSFLSRLFILVRALKKRFYIVIEDENGMDADQFIKYRQQMEKLHPAIDDADNIIKDGHFVLGNKELIDTFHYLNSVSVSPAYNYLMSLKNGRASNKTSNSVNEMEVITRFLTAYESNRKRIHMNAGGAMGVNFVEYMVLLCLFHQKEPLKSSLIHKEIYKHSFNASCVRIKTAFSTLQDKGYIYKHGVFSNAKLSITPIGRDRFIDIFNNFVLKW